jgi:hypothetical protein
MRFKTIQSPLRGSNDCVLTTTTGLRPWLPSAAPTGPMLVVTCELRPAGAMCKCGSRHPAKIRGNSHAQCSSKSTFQQPLCKSAEHTFLFCARGSRNSRGFRSCAASNGKLPARQTFESIGTCGTLRGDEKDSEMIREMKASPVQTLSDISLIMSSSSSSPPKKPISARNFEAANHRSRITKLCDSEMSMFLAQARGNVEHPSGESHFRDR